MYAFSCVGRGLAMGWFLVQMFNNNNNNNYYFQVATNPNWIIHLYLQQWNFPIICSHVSHTYLPELRRQLLENSELTILTFWSWLLLNTNTDYVKMIKVYLNAVQNGHHTASWNRQCSNESWLRFLNYKFQWLINKSIYN